jgi:alkyl hydroperoxide reductase subunit AhpC
VSDL